MEGNEEQAVGIDLGTTYSCVGVWRKKKVEIITNEHGDRTTPSSIAFNNVERLIGEGALNQASRNPTNTIFDVKRLIGRRFSEESVQSDMKTWPFKVTAGKQDKPSIVVNYLNEVKHFSPEEISSMVLLKMKDIASTFLGRPVKKAVVTVPAYFNNSQRQATKDAATIAGLDVIHILNEPTAAALAYSHENKDSCGGHKKTILVFDLGGGTLDVSLIKLDGHGVVEVMATCGDLHLGGQDFDNRMVQHLLELYKEKYGRDVGNNQRCVAKLKKACERAKRTLSTQPATSIEIDAFYEGEDLSTTFHRAKFEDLNMDLFDKCMAPLLECLRNAKVSKNSIDEVVLAGGSTRIPKVQEMLRDFFDGKEPCKSINPDEAVAYGASIQAAMLSNIGDKKDPEAPKLALLDVTPLSLGITVDEGVMSVVIPRNSRVPCVFEREYVTVSDNQREVRFQVVEGERPLSADNNLLGEFVVSGIKAAPAGAVALTCTFRMDGNGILTVTARSKENKTHQCMTISRDEFALTQDEIDRMVREAKVYELQDKERKATLARGMEAAETSSRCVLQ